MWMFIPCTGGVLIFQGLLPESRGHGPPHFSCHSNLSLFIIVCFQLRSSFSQLLHLVIMPRNRESDDVDHVPIDPKPSKVSKKPPPTPWPLPEFTPMLIENPLTYGVNIFPLK